jgi:hypothetical protein
MINDGSMKRALVIFCMATLFAWCKNKPSFTEQVRNDFTNRVLKIDSSIRVDSFQLVRMDSLTEQIGQIVYDSIYAREEARLESELSAAKMNRADTGYVQEEINYMKKELDSIKNLTVKADTIKKYGILASYSYTISKDGKSKTSGVYYFISNNGTILNSDMISDSVKTIAAQLK